MEGAPALPAGLNLKGRQVSPADRLAGLALHPQASSNWTEVRRAASNARLSIATERRQRRLANLQKRERRKAETRPRSWKSASCFRRILPENPLTRAY